MTFSLVLEYNLELLGIWICKVYSCEQTRFSLHHKERMSSIKISSSSAIIITSSWNIHIEGSVVTLFKDKLCVPLSVPHESYWWNCEWDLQVLLKEDKSIVIAAVKNFSSLISPELKAELRLVLVLESKRL